MEFLGLFTGHPEHPTLLTRHSQQLSWHFPSTHPSVAEKGSKLVTTDLGCEATLYSGQH